MGHKPLRPHESSRHIQARIEGITLAQLLLRDELVRQGVETFDEATAYVKTLSTEKQYVLAQLLQEPRDAEFHYLL